MTSMTDYANQAADEYNDVEDAYALPSTLVTGLVTVFLGPFGVVPATVHSLEARKHGFPEGGYWLSFVVGLLLFFLLAAMAWGAIWGS